MILPISANKLKRKNNTHKINKFNVYYFIIHLIINFFYGRDYLKIITKNSLKSGNSCLYALSPTQAMNPVIHQTQWV